MFRYVSIALLLCTAIALGAAIVGSPEPALERDASVTAIPSAYTHPDALIFTGVSKKSHIGITKNTITDDIGFCVNATSAATCITQVALGAGNVLAFDGLGMSENVYMISLTGAPIVLGEINATVW